MNDIDFSIKITTFAQDGRKGDWKVPFFNISNKMIEKALVENLVIERFSEMGEGYYNVNIKIQVN